MEHLLNIQQQLLAQLAQVDKLITNQIPPGQASCMPSEEQLYALIDKCVQKYLKLYAPGNEMMSAISAAIPESDMVWLNSNFQELIPFLHTAEGKQVITHVLTAYKIYKGV